MFIGVFNSGLTINTWKIYLHFRGHILISCEFFVVKIKNWINFSYVDTRWHILDIKNVTDVADEKSIVVPLPWGIITANNYVLFYSFVNDPHVCLVIWRMWWKKNGDFFFFFFYWGLVNRCREEKTSMNVR